MDIGKSIAGFLFAMIGLQLIEGVVVFFTQGLSDFPVMNGVPGAVLGSFFALKLWHHDDDIRRWTIFICKLAYVLVPFMLLFGLLNGRPMTINFPFLHTQTDSPLVISFLVVGCMVCFIVIHLLLTSRKAVAEFTARNDAASNS